MAVNTRPGANRPVFEVKASPTRMDEVIGRQGQYCRVLKAAPCPRLKRGQHVPGCPLCKGTQELYEYQREKRVPDEEIYIPSQNDGAGHILPFWHPIMRVHRVWRHLHEVQGGSVVYPVAGFTDTEITLTAVGEEFPKPYEKVVVDYTVDRYETVTSEQVVSDGAATVRVSGTQIDRQDTHDPEDVRGDIVEVTRVRNMTQLWTYEVDGFNRQDIYLKTTQVGYLAPAVDDVIEVDYRYCPADIIAIEMFEDREQMEKWGHDMKIGDAMATIPSFFDIGQGDLVTLLFAQARREATLVRGAGSYDTLPVFDAVRVVDGEIRDEDGSFYAENTDFEIRNYRQLYWGLGGSVPAAGKKLTMNIMERPTFRIHISGPSHNFAENQRFPQKVSLKRYSVGEASERGRVDK